MVPKFSFGFLDLFDLFTAFARPTWAAKEQARNVPSGLSSGIAQFPQGLGTCEKGRHNPTQAAAARLKSRGHPKCEGASLRLPDYGPRSTVSEGNPKTRSPDHHREAPDKGAVCGPGYH